MTQELSALRMIEFYPSVMSYIFSCYLLVNTLHYFLIVGIFYTVGKVVYLGPCKNYSVIFLITGIFLILDQSVLSVHFLWLSTTLGLMRNFLYCNNNSNNNNKNNNNNNYYYLLGYTAWHRNKNNGRYFVGRKRKTRRDSWGWGGKYPFAD